MATRVSLCIAHTLQWVHGYLVGACFKKFLDDFYVTTHGSPVQWCVVPKIKGVQLSACDSPRSETVSGGCKSWARYARALSLSLRLLSRCRTSRWRTLLDQVLDRL